MSFKGKKGKRKSLGSEGERSKPSLSTVWNKLGREAEREQQKGGKKRSYLTLSYHVTIKISHYRVNDYGVTCKNQI